MNILNDKRLLLCASMVRGRAAADIGTDHGYLPAYLITEGLCDRCIAADINDKPLASARNTAKTHGLEDKIDIILSDGLKKVPLEGITDIIIAGMGGELIAKIIGDCPRLREGGYHLILQAMTRPEALREYLYYTGFEVDEERCVHEGRFEYSVMSAHYIGAQPDYENDERYRFFGRVDLRDPASLAYAEDRLKKLTTAASGMLKSEESKAQGEEIMETVRKLTEIIKYETTNNGEGD